LEIPEAMGTFVYLKVMCSLIDSYLDRKLDVATRIKKAWYGTYFLRYWREWILLNPEYILGDNFITPNAYKCIELNAHSLIANLMALCDCVSRDQQYFSPWLLGSQSCEKAFRTTRSLTPMFSTILNFGVLGFLQRLHRIHIQNCWESQSQQTGINHPHKEVH